MTRWGTLSLALYRSLHPYAPRGTIKRVREWVGNQRTLDPRWGPNAWYQGQEPAELFSLPPAPVVGAGSPMRDGRAVVFVPSSGIFGIRGGRILGEEGTVLSPRGKVLAELTYEAYGHGLQHLPVWRRRRFPKPVHLNGTYVTLSWPSSSAYFHWILESLPRFHCVADLLPGLSGVFYPAHAGRFARESLLAFGVEEDQLFPMGPQSHFACDSLLVPSYCAGMNLPSWVGGFLKDELLRRGVLTSAKPQGRLFISRTDASKRRLLNEDELLSALSPKNFEVLRLSDLSFVDQCRKFYQAELVVAPHGAGLVNVLLAQPGVRVLEIAPSGACPPHVFYAITSRVGGRYWWAGGRPVGSQSGRGDIDRDFRVTSDTIAAIAEWAHQSPAGSSAIPQR